MEHQLIVARVAEGEVDHGAPWLRRASREVLLVDHDQRTLADGIPLVVAGCRHLQLIEAASAGIAVVNVNVASVPSKVAPSARWRTGLMA